MNEYIFDTIDLIYFLGLGILGKQQYLWGIVSFEMDNLYFKLALIKLGQLLITSMV